MGDKPPTIPQEFELVASFNHDLRTILNSHGNRPFALNFYYETLKSQYHYAAANVVAISAAVDCYGAELKIPPRSKELAGLKRLSNSVQRGGLSEIAHRKQCSTATLVAIWSWEIVAHYCWHEMGERSLAKLARLAKKYPTWKEFVDNVNSCMIRRHEESINNAQVSSIGFHDSRSTNSSERSPIEPRDITLLLAGISELEKRRSQLRIHPWIQPCKCLEVERSRVSDQQLSKRTLAYDCFGMLVKSEDAVKRSERCKLCERRQTAPAGKRPISSRDEEALLKRPRFGKLTVPKPMAVVPSPTGELFMNDESGEEQSDHNSDDCGPSVSDHVGEGIPHDLSSKEGTPDNECDQIDGAGSGTDESSGIVPTTPSQTLDNSSKRNAEGYAETLEPEHQPEDTGLDTSPPCQQQMLAPLPLLSGSRSEIMLCTEQQASTGAFGPCSPAPGWRPFGSAPSIQQPTPSPSTGFRCPQCDSECSKCIVPEQFRTEEALKRCRIAHVAHALPQIQDPAQHKRWIAPIRFARLNYSDDLLQHVDATQASVAEADAYVWSWDYFRDRSTAHASLSKPVIIRQEPTDVCYNLQWFLRRLRTTYAGKSLSTRNGKARAPERMKVEKFADLLSSDKPPPMNVLSLDDITFATKPYLTRMDRFTLLERLVSRARVEQSDSPLLAQKSVSCDVESCTHFNIVASGGAFSAPHRDSIGATWIHVLFGSKLWWIVTSSTEADADQLHEQIEKGRPWDPRGRERALILEANDVLVMPHEYPVLHAVLTLEPTLAHGGMFWDEEHIVSVLRLLVHNAKKRHCTNEPMAFQLPAIISGLHQLTFHKGAIPDTNDLTTVRALIDEFNSLKCDCHITFGTCDQGTCPCFMDGRRCWSLCGSHPKGHVKVPLATDVWACMSEDPL